VASNLIIQNMILKDFSSGYCDVKTATGKFHMHRLLFWRENTNIYSGEYSCLSVELTLKRESSPYVATEYIPYSMIVSVSWAPFWLKQKDTLARIGITLVTLFMASAKAADINESLPNVAYTKVLCLLHSYYITIL
jgi:hypothetical protein